MGHIIQKLNKNIIHTFHTWFIYPNAGTLLAKKKTPIKVYVTPKLFFNFLLNILALFQQECYHQYCN
jgi:hypothetical protein